MAKEYAAEFVEPAKAFLNSCRNVKITGKVQGAVKNEVINKLLDFCEQDAEFAQAVAQKKDFQGCLNAVAQGVGQYLSDIDVYMRAVQFYFSGATIQCTMTICLEGETQDKPDKLKKRRIDLSIADIL